MPFYVCIFSFSFINCLSIRFLLQVGPYINMTSIQILDVTSIKPTIVNIQPIPIPLIPGSIQTVAIALRIEWDNGFIWSILCSYPNIQRTKLFEAVMDAPLPGNKSINNVWVVAIMPPVPKPTIKQFMSNMKKGNKKKRLTKKLKY